MNWHDSHITATAIRLATPLVQKTGQEVLDGARHLAPEGSHLSGSGRPREGLTLQGGFYTTINAGIPRVRMRIGNRADHAATIHQGSQAHIIRSRSGKMLKFTWERGDFLVAARAGRRKGRRITGRFHYFAHVRHPGNKRPLQYLIRPLQMFGRLNGFRVTSTPYVNRTFLP